MKIRVYHSYYGCDTGCCGHVVEVNGKSVGPFNFDHPYGEDPKVFARELAEEAIRQHMPDCLPTIDWESLEIDGVCDEC